MSTFGVQLKKVVDDSYEIEIGFGLEDKLIQDIRRICFSFRREKRVRQERLLWSYRYEE